MAEENHTMTVVLSCCYQTAEENHTLREWSYPVATKRQRRTTHNESGLKLLLTNGRGEPHTMGVVLCCCYQTAEENHTQ
jgi:hypothetical protein